MSTANPPDASSNNDRKSLFFTDEAAFRAIVAGGR